MVTQNDQYYVIYYGKLKKSHAANREGSFNLDLDWGPHINSHQQKQIEALDSLKETLAHRNHKDACWQGLSYDKGNHNLIRDHTLITENVGPHLTKCMDYHQTKILIIPIDFTISNHYRKIVQMVQSSTMYSFTHMFVPKSQITKILSFTKIVDVMFRSFDF